MTRFEDVWRRIQENERAFFQTPSGRWFTYRLDGDAVLPSQSELRIPREDFERVFGMLPVASAQKLGRFVTGAAYLWSILHDPRISQGEW